jgi:hypothetical protein
MKFAIPIFMNDTFLGVAGGCGKLKNGGKVDAYLVYRTAGLDKGAITSLSESVKPISDDRLLSVVRYLEKKLDEIIRESRASHQVQYEPAN